MLCGVLPVVQDRVMEPLGVDAVDRAFRAVLVGFETGVVVNAAVAPPRTRLSMRAAAMGAEDAPAQVVGEIILGLGRAAPLTA